MKIAYRFGHMLNCDQGASGIIMEYDFNRLYGSKVVEYLAKEGHQLLNCTPTSSTSMGDSLAYGVNKANQWGADLFISFHGNAFNGNAKGSEVVCGSDKGLVIGGRIVEKLGSLGFTKRKAYIDVRGLYEIRHTSMTAIIIEPLFVDSKVDIDLFNKVGVDTFGKAIAEGILGKTISNSQPKPQPKPQPQGDSGILQLQKAMNRLGFVGGNGRPLVEDGINGLNTKTAVERFQRTVGLQADGVAGNMTWGAINTIIAKPFVEMGATNKVAIRYIQYRVGCGIDGVFGRGTKKAVANWQNSHGLAGDGQVGNKTWEKLIG